MHGVTLRMTLCSVTLYTLISSTGCRTAVPDRSLQAEVQPATAPSDGLLSSLAQRFQASPNQQTRPSGTTAASAQQQKPAAPPSANMPATATLADKESDELIEAFSNATPEVQAAARQQLAAVRNMQQTQAAKPAADNAAGQPNTGQPAAGQTAAGQIAAGQVGGPTIPTPAKEISLPKPGQSKPMAHTVATVSDQVAATNNPVQQATATAPDQQSQAAVAFATPPPAESSADSTAPVEQVAAATPAAASAEPETKTIQLEAEVPEVPVAASMNPKEHLEALIKHYEEQEISLDTPGGLTQMAKLRMLYLLADKPDQAMEKVDQLNAAEQDYLRYQMMTMWSMVDPDGSPSRTRRWEKALENLRLASGHLAAATESLDVSSIAFCTEVESYGRITPFKDYKLQPGQQVILYCEIDNFASERLSDGYETHFQGSYDLFNADGVRVAEQVLPADKQSCNNYRRDYFIAYRLYLPKQLAPGPHRIQLTIEDLKGKKFGQSTLDFEIVAKAEAPAK